MQKKFKDETPEERATRLKLLIESRLAFTRQEVAELLGRNYVTIWRLERKGLLTPCKKLRTPMFTRQEIDRFLAPE